MFRSIEEKKLINPKEEFDEQWSAELKKIGIDKNEEELEKSITKRKKMRTWNRLF